MDDLRILLNFYAYMTLLCGLSPNQTDDTGEGTMANVINDAAVDDNETDWGLYCISGGTLCEIMKVNKRRVNNNNLRSIKEQERNQ